MQELVIKEINNFIYTLEGKNNKYKISMEFNVDYQPQVNDKIYMYDELLTEKFLSFGLLDHVSGRQIRDSKDPDLIILANNNTKMFLKRLYG